MPDYDDDKYVDLSPQLQENDEYVDLSPQLKKSDEYINLSPFKKEGDVRRSASDANQYQNLSTLREESEYQVLHVPRGDEPYQVLHVPREDEPYQVFDMKTNKMIELNKAQPDSMIELNKEYKPLTPSSFLGSFKIDIPDPLNLNVLHDIPGYKGKYMVGDTLVYYYVPDHPDPPLRSREILVGLHGAGTCGHVGALNKIDPWITWANNNNVIIIAPILGKIFGPQPKVQQWPFITHDAGGRPYNASSFFYEGNNPPRTREEKCAYFQRYLEWSCMGSINPSVITQFVSQYDQSANNQYLHNFPFALNKNNALRADREILKIVDVFQDFFFEHQYYVSNPPKFSVFGHSGGGQLASRLLLLHPERLRRICISGPATHMFPSHEPMFPNGMRCQWEDVDKIIISGRKYTPDPEGNDACQGLLSFFNKSDYNYRDLNQWAGDIVNTSERKWNQKLRYIFENVDVYISVGHKDNGPCYDKPNADFQGTTRLQRARNYYNTMKAVYLSLYPNNSPHSFDFRLPRMRFIELAKPDEYEHSSSQAGARRELTELNNWWNGIF